MRPIQLTPGALSMGVKRPEHEADHSPSSSAEVKNAWSYTSTPRYVFIAWWLVKHRDYFTLLYITLLYFTLKILITLTIICILVEKAMLNEQLNKKVMI
jgi:hypothetical protein